MLRKSRMSTPSALGRERLGGVLAAVRSYGVSSPRMFVQVTGHPIHPAAYDDPAILRPGVLGYRGNGERGDGSLSARTSWATRLSPWSRNLLKIHRLALVSAYGITAIGGDYRKQSETNRQFSSLSHHMTCNAADRRMFPFATARRLRLSRPNGSSTPTHCRTTPPLSPCCRPLPGSKADPL